MEGSWLKRCYYGFVQCENFVGNFLLLIIRLYWGGLLVLTGWGKLTNAEGVAEFFASLDLPVPLFTAYLVGLAEFLGGISLFLGLFSRVFALILSIVFIVAYATAHTVALTTVFVNPKLFLMQDPFLFLYASLVVLSFGAGMFSFDRWIEKSAYGRPL